MSDSADEDLRDVFKLLYDDNNDWGGFDDDDDHPPLDAIAPEIEVEAVEEDVSVREARARDLERYSKKRYLSDLDALLFHPPPTAKKPRIYPPRARLSSNAVIPSTSPVPPLPPSSTYAPYSPLALLSRLRTFQPSTYSPAYPPMLSARQAALHGWCNEGREGLKCAQSGVRWGLGGFEDIKDAGVRLEVARRLSRGFETRHGKECPWGVRRSPDALYDQLRVMLHPMISTSLAALAVRIQVECLSLSRTPIRWRLPLNEKDSTTLLSTLLRSTTPSEEEAGYNDRSKHSPSPSAREITPLAAALAFFCWYPYTVSSTKTTATPPTSPERPTSITSSPAHTTDIVSCRICQRRIGLWTFRAEKTEDPSSNPNRPEFDLVNEHLSWCPIRQDQWWETVPLLRFTAGEGQAVRVKDVRVSADLVRRPWWK